MKLLLENLPPSLEQRRETLVKCLVAMGQVRHVRAIYLFGSAQAGATNSKTELANCTITSTTTGTGLSAWTSC